MPGSLTVEADVRNTGSFAGDEVAELYFRPPHSADAQTGPRRIQRFHLNPGETRHVTFTLDPRTLSQVDEKGTRAVLPGRYQISLGGSQPDGDAGQGVQSKEFNIVGTEQIPR